jgi:hypothetical protein
MPKALMKRTDKHQWSNLQLILETFVVPHAARWCLRVSWRRRLCYPALRSGNPFANANL